MNKKLFSNLSRIFLFITVYCLLFTVSYAGTPPGINYQGRYLEAGVPYTGTRGNCQFKIYDAYTGGTVRWGSPAVTLTFDKGLFNYVIECSSHDWKAYDSYLEVTINNTALSPRERLQASPYAFFASSANYADSASVADGSVTTAKIADRQVSSPKIIITSTFTNISPQVWISTGTTVGDVPGMYGVLNVSSRPAVIFVTCTVTLAPEAANTGFLILSVDGTAISKVQAKRVAADYDFPATCTAMYRVTGSGGDVVVKAQVQSGGGTLWIGYGNFAAYWVGAP